MGECGCNLEVTRCRDHVGDRVVVLEGGDVTDEMIERAMAYYRGPSQYWRMRNALTAALEGTERT